MVTGVVSLWEVRGTQCHIPITLLPYGTGLRALSAVCCERAVAALHYKEMTSTIRGRGPAEDGIHALYYAKEQVQRLTFSMKNCVHSCTSILSFLLLTQAS